jgi:hypothetical protein
MPLLLLVLMRWQVKLKSMRLSWMLRHSRPLVTFKCRLIEPVRLSSLEGTILMLRLC